MKPPYATLTRSCFTRLNGIRTSHRTMLAARCSHSFRSVSGQQPQFVLHSADRHSGGSVRFVSLVAAVNRSKIDTEEKIGFNNRYSAYTFGSKPGSLRLGSIREDQSVLSLKLPESLRASSAIHISETEPTRVQIRLEQYRVSRPATLQQSS